VSSYYAEWLDVWQPSNPGAARLRTSEERSGVKVKVLSMPIAGPGGRRIIYRGVWVSAGTVLEATGGDLPGTVTYTLGIIEEPPQLVITDLHVSAEAIQSTPLRKIRIPKLLTEAVRAVVRDAPELFRGPSSTDVDTGAAAMTRHPTKRVGHGRILPDSKLREVARVYRSNPARPYLAVAETFDIPRSTAGEYIKRAREAGLIDNFTQRGSKK
jgi:hypothetical protein